MSAHVVVTPEGMKAFRARHELSAAQFARLVGVAGGRTVRWWESGGRGIPGPVARLIHLLESCSHGLRDQHIRWAKSKD